MYLGDTWRFLYLTVFVHTARPEAGEYLHVPPHAAMLVVAGMDVVGSSRRGTRAWLAIDGRMIACR